MECVPNFSEGKRKDVIDAICKAAKSVSGVSVLDCESDPHHNRMVLTFVGAPEQVKKAALASSSVAVKLIDLTKHSGEHPRMGAVDVVPFVPLRDTTLEECIVIANEFAAEYSQRHQVPVFLYEAAARTPARKDLAHVREGEFEGLRDLVGNDPKKEPDYGPRTMHPTAGATAVGARRILIAYNVNLGTTDLSIAKKIAHAVRGRDGGLPEVKALGFELKEKKMVQVSMNLTDYRTTSILKAFEKVSDCARDHNIAVVESEIVGLVPLEALTDGAQAHLKLSNFAPNQIIENGLIDMLTKGTDNSQKNGVDFSKLSLGEFAARIASKKPTPGGGTAAAYAGVLSASLLVMVCKLTIGKKGYEFQQSRILQILRESEDCASQLMELGNKDSKAYSRVAGARALPKTTVEEKMRRSAELKIALKEATAVPSETIFTSLKVFRLAREALDIANRNARSDSETAMELARSAIKGAWSNVKINLESLEDEPQFVVSTKGRLEPILSEID